MVEGLSVIAMTYYGVGLAAYGLKPLAKTLGAQAHISLRAPEDLVAPAARLDAGTAVLSDTQPRAQRLRSVANWQALLPVLQATPGVAAVSPMVSGAGLALRGEAALAIALMGVELERYDRIVNLRSKVVAGRASLQPGEAIIGRELAADPAKVAAMFEESDKGRVTSDEQMDRRN